MERRPTDQELGIDVTAINAEAVIMGAMNQAPAILAEIRAQRLAEWQAKQILEQE